jgi:hypothetical protein
MHEFHAKDRFVKTVRTGNYVQSMEKNWVPNKLNSQVELTFFAKNI